MKLLRSLAVCIPAHSAGKVFDLPGDRKEMCFAGSALLSQVKPLNVWMSSGIASVQKSIVQFTKNPEVYRGSSLCCYHTILDKQQL